MLAVQLRVSRVLQSEGDEFSAYQWACLKSVPASSWFFLPNSVQCLSTFIDNVMIHRPHNVLTGVPVYHFDLSYWAFEKLAHPVYGLQMVDFKPVSCLTTEPLQFLPGVFNSCLGLFKRTGRYPIYMTLQISRCTTYAIF